MLTERRREVKRLVERVCVNVEIYSSPDPTGVDPSDFVKDRLETICKERHGLVPELHYEGNDYLACIAHEALSLAFAVYDDVDRKRYYLLVVPNYLNVRVRALRKMVREW